MQAAERAHDADLAADLALLLDAAREAGKVAMRFYRRNPEVWLKGGVSPVSEADYAADRFLHDVLTAARPGYGWLSEETADSAARLEARRTFVVDPIDGTRGYLDGHSEWCVAVAVVEQGRPIAGVLECPAKQETFFAMAAGGAHKNGQRLHVRETRSDALVGGPVSMINALPQPIRHQVRRSPYVPSLAYRIAMVADGTLDATFVKPNSRDWDLAAADIILQEAGGAILDQLGRPPAYGRQDTAHGALVCGRGELLKVMASTIHDNG